MREGLGSLYSTKSIPTLSHQEDFQGEYYLLVSIKFALMYMAKHMYKKVFTPYIRPKVEYAALVGHPT